MIPLSIIAETGEKFREFVPYVASINEAGRVAFQARLASGQRVIAAGDGANIEIVAALNAAGDGGPCSHPDLNLRGDVCFYADGDPHERGVYRLNRGVLSRVAESVGPLGPTINEIGNVAYRSGGVAGHGAVRVSTGTESRLVAEAGPRYMGFHGLPVINNRDQVLFRAERTDGRHGIYIADGQRHTTVVETGDEFRELAAFPMFNDNGTVVYAGTRISGESGIFVARGGESRLVVGQANGFAHFRGALIDNAGRVVFFATPVSGSLGIFSLDDPASRLMLGIDSAVAGSQVTDFALNPVSLNNRGQLAVRLRLADSRQLIVRLDCPPCRGGVR